MSGRADGSDFLRGEEAARSADPQRHSFNSVECPPAPSLPSRAQPSSSESKRNLLKMEATAAWPSRPTVIRAKTPGDQGPSHHMWDMSLMLESLAINNS